MIGIKKHKIDSNNSNNILSSGFTELGVTALIDADSLLYFSCYGSEEDKDLSEAKLSEKIYDILNILSSSYNITSFCLFVKGNNNFRYKIYPDYKAKRPEKPEMVDILKQYLIDEFNTVISHNAESDDYVYTYSQLDCFKDKCIICSVDKDMLQIPGLHYNYQKNIYIPVDDFQSRYSLAFQMLKGDTTDNIKCLKGYGEKTAQKILGKTSSSNQYSERDLIRILIQEYKKMYNINNNEYKEQIRLNYKLLKLQKMNVDENNLIINKV